MPYRIAPRYAKDRTGSISGEVGASQRRLYSVHGAAGVGDALEMVLDYAPATVTDGPNVLGRARASYETPNNAMEPDAGGRPGGVWWFSVEYVPGEMTPPQQSEVVLAMGIQSSTARVTASVRPPAIGFPSGLTEDEKTKIAADIGNGVNVRLQQDGTPKTEGYDRTFYAETFELIRRFGRENARRAFLKFRGNMGRINAKAFTPTPGLTYPPRAVRFAGSNGVRWLDNGAVEISYQFVADGTATVPAEVPEGRAAYEGQVVKNGQDVVWMYDFVRPNNDPAAGVGRRPEVFHIPVASQLEAEADFTDLLNGSEPA